MRQSTRFKRPWYVYSDKLRPSFRRIVEIVDDNGDVVLPWPGFDATCLPHKSQLRLAQMIVDAVNAKEAAR
jgi:hypothetical protein